MAAYRHSEYLAWGWSGFSIQDLIISIYPHSRQRVSHDVRIPPCYDFAIHSQHAGKVVNMTGCSNQDCSVEYLHERQRGTLTSVLAINALMFLVVVSAAFYAKSSALLADSLDNLGDAVTYGLSLYAVSRDATDKAKVALFKGLLIFLASLTVAGQIVYRLFVPGIPVFEVMGMFSLLGLAANSICLFLLWRHRQDDVNMSSVWECSRNDIASNISVFIAAGAVWFTGSGWPDTVVAAGLTVFLMRSAIRVISSAIAELRAAP